MASLIWASLFLPPANEVRRKVIFSQACDIPSVNGGGGCLHPGEVCIEKGGLHRGGGMGRPPTLHTMGYGQRAGGTHPTGMHSCHERVYSSGRTS